MIWSLQYVWHRPWESNLKRLREANLEDTGFLTRLEGVAEINCSIVVCLRPSLNFSSWYCWLRGRRKTGRCLDISDDQAGESWCPEVQGGNLAFLGWAEVPLETKTAWGTFSQSILFSPLKTGLHQNSCFHLLSWNKAHGTTCMFPSSFWKEGG